MLIPLRFKYRDPANIPIVKNGTYKSRTGKKHLHAHKHQWMRGDGLYQKQIAQIRRAQGTATAKQ